MATRCMILMRAAATRAGAVPLSTTTSPPRSAAPSVRLHPRPPPSSPAVRLNFACVCRMHRVVCTVSYAPCRMHRVVCTVLYAPCRMHRAVCTVSYAPCRMHRVVCTVPYAPCRLHRAVCTVSYAPCRMHRVVCTLPYAPCRMHRVVCTVPYRQIVRVTRRRPLPLSCREAATSWKRWRT
jgi:hypothetical protein